jgi:hypothetical protein
MGCGRRDTLTPLRRVANETRNSFNNASFLCSHNTVFKRTAAFHARQSHSDISVNKINLLKKTHGIVYLYFAELTSQM